MEKEIIIANKYLIIRKIGEGGTAKVYLAYDQLNERNVTLKILKKDNIDERKIKKFKKEAETLALLDDDNIVKIYDVGEDNGLHFIVTEYIDGMTLKDYIKTCSPIPTEEIISISMQILKGIKHAHSKNVVHKDLKSQNILLDENKKVKITDFGIADILDEDITRTQSLMGTPQYIAPEILNRDSLTSQSDIYSIGIMMYEMAMTTVPFSGEKVAYIMIRQMSQPLPSITVERKDIPQSLENIIIKASAKKLENRYQNVDEMISDLEKCLLPENLEQEKLILENDIFTSPDIEKTIDLSSYAKESIQKKENKDKSKRMERKIILIAIGIISILIFSYFFLSFKQGIKMPNLVGEQETNIINELKVLGIKQENIIIKYETSDDIPLGEVIKTEPPENEKITKNQQITVYVSQGVETIKVENYRGELAENIKKQLEKKGLVVNIVNEASDVKEGVITNQEPSLGTQLKKGEQITLYVSTGPAKIIVPNFSNMKKEEVDRWAKDNKISITYQSTCNNSVLKNHIISQSINYGVEISQGEQIMIVVSEGECEVSNEQS